MEPGDELLNICLVGSSSCCTPIFPSQGSQKVGECLFKSECLCHIVCFCLRVPILPIGEGRRKQKIQKNLVPITSVFSYYMEPVCGLSMGKIWDGGTENILRIDGTRSRPIILVERSTSASPSGICTG